MSLPTQRVTMTDVAKAAGVARSTVSKALRNDPRIPVGRCREIQRIAAEMNYRPHPMVAALMSQIHGGRRDSDPYSLSWIDLWPPGQRNPLAPFGNELLTGAQRRAKELNYQIEVHQVAPEQLSPRRLSDILNARAQWGLIIPPVPDSFRTLELDIHGFASVTIGTSLRQPVIHRVSSDHYQGGQLAFHHTRAKGHKAIGLVLGRRVNDRTNGKWLAAFLERQWELSPNERVPPLILESSDQTSLAKWLGDHRPDAVLLAEPEIAEAIANAAGPKVPRNVWLVTERHWTGISGVDHQPELLGAVAVDLIVGQIHRNERGSPAVAQTLLLENRWIDNASAPARR